MPFVPSFTRNGSLFAMAAMGVLVLSVFALAQTSQPMPTDEQVWKLVQDLQEEIFKYQVNEWALLKGQKGPDGRVIPAAAEDGKPLVPIMYRNVKTTEEGYEATDASGNVTKYGKEEVLFLQPPGHFQPDYYGQFNYGGNTTLAIWALVATNFPHEDPRMQKAMQSYFEGSMVQGTYSLSFRLNVLSHLIRWRSPKVAENYKKYIDRDTDVLIKAMSETGQYTYQAYPPRGYIEDPPASWIWKGRPARAGSDNSNTQFGVFGVGAAEDALVEVDPMFWQNQDEWWLGCQQQDGHWTYVKDRSISQSSDINMTIAGMNSLYLVIDKLYSQQSKDGYAPLQGFQYPPEAFDKMRKDFTAIHKGFSWLETNIEKLPRMNELTPLAGYYYYGLKRLGMNSGRKYIAGHSWFKETVQWAYQDGKMPVGVKDAKTLQQLVWRLLCLGGPIRAPVIFNKLDTGDETDWNYYPQDVAHFVEWLGPQTCWFKNWQIVDLKSDLFDLQDAPILFISGEKALHLTENEQNKLKAFCDFGGTIFLHPNHDSLEFKKSAKELFVKMYVKEGYEFNDVPQDHRIYLGNIGREVNNPQRVAKDLVPLCGMSDGGRYFIFLVNGDIAGAWQLRLQNVRRELFQVMLNLWLYTAPIHNDLPSKLRPKLPTLEPGPNKVVVARLKHNGHSTANPRLYEALGYTMAMNGYGIDLRDQVMADENSLKGVHVIHITGHNSFTLTPHEIAAIKQAVQGGAFLLIDPAYGRMEFLESAKTLVQQLGLTEKVIDSPKDHPLFKDVKALKPNRWLAGGIKKAFIELRLDDKPVGLLSTVDITAAANGHTVFDNPAIGTEAARMMWVNVAAAASKIPPTSSPMSAGSQPDTSPATTKGTTLP